MNYHISVLDIIGITVSLIIIVLLAYLKICLWFKYKNKKTTK